MKLESIHVCVYIDIYVYSICMYILHGVIRHKHR